MWSDEPIVRVCLWLALHDVPCAHDSCTHSWVLDVAFHWTINHRSLNIHWLPERRLSLHTHTHTHSHLLQSHFSDPIRFLTGRRVHFSLLCLHTLHIYNFTRDYASIFFFGQRLWSTGFGMNSFTLCNNTLHPNGMYYRQPQCTLYDRLQKYRRPPRQQDERNVVEIVRGSIYTRSAVLMKIQIDVWILYIRAPEFVGTCV